MSATISHARIVETLARVSTVSLAVAVQCPARAEENVRYWTDTLVGATNDCRTELRDCSLSSVPSTSRLEMTILSGASALELFGNFVPIGLAQGLAAALHIGNEAFCATQSAEVERHAQVRRDLSALTANLHNWKTSNQYIKDCDMARSVAVALLQTVVIGLEGHTPALAKEVAKGLTEIESLQNTLSRAMAIRAFISQTEDRITAYIDA